MKRVDLLAIISVVYISVLTFICAELTGDVGIWIGCALGSFTVLLFGHYVITHKKLKEWLDEEIH